MENVTISSPVSFIDWSNHVLDFQAEVMKRPTLVIATGIVAVLICIVTLSPTSNRVSSFATPGVGLPGQDRKLTAASRKMATSRKRMGMISLSMGKTPLP